MGYPASPMTDDVLAALDPAQREAAETVRGPVRILAGAGSGKTRTITHRIAEQVRSGAADASEVLAVTFTDRAARELRARLHRLGLPHPVRAATFHAAAWAQLRHFWAEAHPDRPTPEVLTSKVGLLVPSARRLRAEARDLAAEIEWAKAAELAPETYVDGLGRREPPIAPEQMAEVFAAYEDEKRARGLVDYDDMITMTTAMLQTHPRIAETVRDRYRVFTVDEFQDVNTAQHSLLLAWLGDRDDLCVVGDDDQTIYSFTGASSRYLTEFPTRFPNARTVELVDNYRSTAEVLTLANRVLAAGSVRPKRLRAQVDGGPEPRVLGFDDETEERSSVVEAIRHLLAEGVPAGEIAVVYRINSQSEPWEAALADAGIPYAVRGDEGFFARPEIAQAIRLLRTSLGSAEPDSTPPPPADARPSRPPSADRHVERVLREGLSWHPKREPSGAVARERWRNLGALLAIAERAVAADAEVTVEEVVADLERRAREGEASPEPDGAVALLTIHRAKGLEFDAVFVVGCEEGLLPISYAKDPADLAEERRLLYVAVTRARRHLWLSWAASRTGPRGRPSRRRRSQFLEGLVAEPAREVDRSLATTLRAWRRARAEQEGVPAYVVFPDRTLEELAARRPTTRRELSRVPGLGPTRMSRYGDDLLAVLGG